ncbi:extracellular solute-binding protein [Litoreibacter albidus]|uniref:extracellular solute-binding protein n=1 Tax=Litoreibacter albidus TaxID=670155 RepID=UPI003736A769
MKNRHSQALARRHPAQSRRMKWMGAGLLLVAATLTSVTVARAETIIKAHGFSDFGELKYPEGFAHLDYVNPDAPKGGEVSVSASGTFDSMNPFSRKGRAGALSGNAFEQLMVTVDDDPYGSYCLLCESLEYPESQEWVIFNLRPEAKFSDGTPLTAHDVVFTVNSALTDGLPSFAKAVSKFYKSYEALDDHRIKFTFNDGLPRKGLILQAGASFVFSKAWFEANNANIKDARLEPAVGSGPYVAKVIDPPRRLIYERNPDYWGADLPINKGRWNFDSIRIEYFADDTAAMEAFKSGVYNFRRESSSLKWATAYDFPGVKDGTIVKAELPNGSLPPAYGMVFNLRRDKFDDPRVREALQLMYNFTWTNETLQFGLFAQRDSFWQNTDLAAHGVAEGLELEYLKSVEHLLEDKSVLTEPVVMAHKSSGRQLDRKNMRKANALLAEAGWEADANGVLSKDGKPLEIEFLSGSVAYDRLIQPYIENLKRVGIQAKYTRVDPAQYTNRERGFDWDMIYDGYANYIQEDNGISQRFGSEDAEYSLFNPSGYSSPAVDALIKVMLDAKTLEEMQAAVRAADRILRAARIMIPAWYNDTFWVAYYDMFEHPEKLPPLALGHLDFWWYNADKAAALKAKGAL